MYSAILDACVLVPNALCDTLLRLPERAFYRPQPIEVTDRLRQGFTGVSAALVDLDPGGGQCRTDRVRGLGFNVARPRQLDM